MRFFNSFIVTLFCFCSLASASLSIGVVSNGETYSGMLPATTTNHRFDMSYFSFEVPSNALSVTIDQVSGTSISVTSRGRLPCSQAQYSNAYPCSHHWTVNSAMTFFNGIEGWSTGTWFIGVARTASILESVAVNYTFKASYVACEKEAFGTLSDNYPSCIAPQTYLLARSNKLSSSAVDVSLFSGSDFSATQYGYINFMMTSSNPSLSVTGRGGSPAIDSGVGNSYDCRGTGVAVPDSDQYSYTINCDVKIGSDFFVNIHNPSGVAFNSTYLVNYYSCPLNTVGTTCDQRMTQFQSVSKSAVALGSTGAYHFYYDFPSESEAKAVMEFTLVSGSGKIVVRRGGIGNTLSLFDYMVDFSSSEVITLLPQDFFLSGRVYVSIISTSDNLDFGINIALSQYKSSGDLLTSGSLTTGAITTGRTILNVTIVSNATLTNFTQLLNSTMNSNSTTSTVTSGSMTTSKVPAVTTESAATSARTMTSSHMTSGSLTTGSFEENLDNSGTEALQYISMIAVALIAILIGSV